MIVYGLILILGVYASLSSPNFLTDRNIFNVLRTAAFLGTVAIGETFVIISGGIDLSVGSVIKLSVLMSAIFMNGKAGKYRRRRRRHAGDGRGRRPDQRPPDHESADCAVHRHARRLQHFARRRLYGHDHAGRQSRAWLPAPVRPQGRACRRCW